MLFSTALETLLSGIEDDSDFRAFCLSRFGCRIIRAPESVSLSDQTTERLTLLHAFPDDWDYTIFNSPIHLFFTSPSQEFNPDTDNYQCSDYDIACEIMCRFSTDTQVTDIYDFINQLTICLRGIKTAGYAPNFRGISSEFIYIENSFPAVQCRVVADTRLSDINDKETD